MGLRMDLLLCHDWNLRFRILPSNDPQEKPGVFSGSLVRPVGRQRHFRCHRVFYTVLAVRQSENARPVRLRSGTFEYPRAYAVGVYECAGFEVRQHIFGLAQTDES